MQRNEDERSGLGGGSSAQSAQAAEQFPVLDALALIERADLSSALRVLRLRMAFPPEMISLAVQPLINSFALWVQMLPAADSARFAHPCGQLLRGMVQAIRALDRRRHQILPRGAAPEEIGERAHRWTYAVFVAALLWHLPRLDHGLRVTLTLKAGREQLWSPSDGSMGALGATSYRFEILSPMGASIAAPDGFAWQVFEAAVPVCILEWLAQDSQLLAELRAMLDGSVNPTGVLADLVLGNSAGTVAVRGSTGSADASPQVSRPLAASGQPGQLSTILTSADTPDHLGPVEADPSGIGLGGQFLAWLGLGIETGKLQVNGADGLVFVVAEGLLLVSPGIFRAFAQQRGTAKESLVDATRRARRAVLSEGWHVRGEGGVTMLAYEWMQPDGLRVRVHGIVMRRPERFLVDLPVAHPGLVRVNPVNPVNFGAGLSSI